MKEPLVNDVPLSNDVTAPMIAHMNDDHADSVLHYVRRYASLPEATAAVLLAIEPTHMSIEAIIGGSARTVDVAFDHTLSGAADAHATLIAMARTA